MTSLGLFSKTDQSFSRDSEEDIVKIVFTHRVVHPTKSKLSKLNGVPINCGCKKKKVQLSCMQIFIQFQAVIRSATQIA